MNTQTIDKESLRSLLKEKKRAVSPAKKREAREELLSFCRSFLTVFETVLSFASLPEEIDTSALNEQLAHEGRLLLPKVDNTSLAIYQVFDLKQLLPSQWGIFEPDPTHCPRVDLLQISCVLVPGLGFDKHHRRIGYGKGYYDRLLEQLKVWGHAKAIGLGFREQLYEGDLPHEPHDLILDGVFLA